MTRKSEKGWNLQAELDHLERTDPVVRAAKHKLDSVADLEARYQRHLAARKAVGKRPMPEEEK